MSDDLKIKMRNRVKEFRVVPVSELQENERNFRLHPETQTGALAGVLDEVGQAGALVAYHSERNGGTLTLIDGHARLVAGGDEWPCVILDVDDSEADYLLATFDAVSALAEIDSEKIGALLADVNSGNPDVQQMLADLAGMNLAGMEGETDEDSVPEVGEDATSKRGKIYQLGGHRLMCGDSTSEKDVVALMDGQKANVIFTDLPYGVAIGDKNKFLNTFQPSERCLENIAGDCMGKDELFDMLVGVFTLAKKYSNSCCSVYVCSPQGGELGMMMMMMMIQAGLPVRHVLNWVKNSPTFSMGRLDYEYQHEPILYTWTETHKHYGNGLFKTSIWNIDKPWASKLHPTMKPVELYENAYLNSSEVNTIAYEPFSGSGTAFLACEKTSRICYGMEITEKYCDVIRKRWAEFVHGEGCDWKRLTKEI